MGAAMKRADIRSPSYLAWVRSQPCYFAGSGCVGRSHAHHFPPKGRLGYTDDLSTLPVCAIEHERCHGLTVCYDGKRRKPIPEHEQHFAALVTCWRFWHQAEPAVRQAVVTELGDFEPPKAVPW
jgi:hypothetical protein